MRKTAVWWFSLFTCLSTLVVVFASESGGAPSSSCPVKSFEGSYSYDSTAENGPVHWGNIEDEPYATCGEGQSQSPIDLPGSVMYAPLESGPHPDLASANMTVSSGSYNWALNCDGCGRTTYKGKEYELINIHFHSPSEHRFNGTAYPLEAHMVHKASDGSLAVIGTMFEYAEDSYPAIIAAAGSVDYGTSQILKKAFKALTAGYNTIPLGSIIDTKKGYCSYSGSLTTPPCTEGVTWFLSQNIVTVSRRQVADYRLYAGVGLNGNNRPTQPMHERNVTCFILWEKHLTYWIRSPWQPLVCFVHQKESRRVQLMKGSWVDYGIISFRRSCHDYSALIGEKSGLLLRSYFGRWSICSWQEMVSSSVDYKRKWRAPGFHGIFGIMDVFDDLPDIPGKIDSKMHLLTDFAINRPRLRSSMHDSPFRICTASCR